MPYFTLHWQQSNPEDVTSWEFQFQRVGSEQWEWVQRVEPVDNCVSCFEAIIEIPEDAILVRSRAVGLEEYSAWSNEIHALPEADFCGSLIVGALWVFAMRIALVRLRK